MDRWCKVIAIARSNACRSTTTGKQWLINTSSFLRACVVRQFRLNPLQLRLKLRRSSKQCPKKRGTPPAQKNRRGRKRTGRVGQNRVAVRATRSSKPRRFVRGG